MKKSSIFLLLLSSFISGVFSASFWGFSESLFFACLILSVIILTFWYRQKIIIIFVFSILFFLGGYFRAGMEIGEAKSYQEIKRIEGFGIIKKEPERKKNFQNIVVAMGDGEKILVKVDAYESYQYGDEILLSCQAELPQNFSADFDYRMYLAKDDIFYLCQNSKIEKTGKNLGNKIYKAVLDFRKSMEKNVARVISQPYAALGSGLLFGGSNRLSDEYSEKFSKTSMTHIVAVSGYNVAIIAEYLVLAAIFLGFWRQQAFWIAVIGIFFFVAMIGFPSSAVRAGIMGVLLLWASKNGRLSKALNMVVLAGFLMLVWNPLLLRWDIGFQLSFLATLGIILFSPILEGWQEKNRRENFGIMEIIFTTLSAQLFVLPVIFYNFHNFSLVSFPANILILPVVPLAMLLVFAVATIGFLSLSLGQFFGLFAYFPLKYEIAIIDFLSEIEWANIHIEQMSWWVVAAWYGVLLFLIVRFKKQKHETEENNL